uniref:Putative reverse transcriptase domain-containing protein n=1 Tax=Tanacetum cinerariifolium TaxID=118510 RepID=A0A6L2K614_TANCI|nr:putative reverse transcriptase domain-containing protein [Tanacetum cinerariifolium]
MCQRRWIELFNDYDYEIRYHLGKANIVADALSRKERLKQRRARAMSMKIHSSIKARILEAQSEASKGVNTLAEMLKGLDKQFERKEDGVLYLAKRIWVLVYGILRTLIKNEAHATRTPETLGITSTARDSRIEMGEHHNGLYKKRALGTRMDFSAAYHPKTDGQSESTIQTLEYMLRACATDFGGNRDTHLPKPLEFSVGDKVLLKVSPRKCVVRFGKRSKLSPRYVGPFEIVERVGLVAYRMRLQQDLIGIHDTFHVSNLKKCQADVNLHVPLEEVKIDDKLHFVEEPIEIMDREVKKLKGSRIPVVKVRWNSRRGPELTWERKDEMKRNSLYPPQRDEMLVIMDSAIRRLAPPHSPHKEEEKQDDEFIHTHDDYVPTNDETNDESKEFDEEEYEELYGDEGAANQVKDDAQETQKTEGPIPSSSILSDYAAKYLNFDNILPVDTKAVSMLDINVQHEVPCTLPLLTISVSVIPEHTIVNLLEIVTIVLSKTISSLLSSLFPHLQQLTPIPTPTTTESTTSTTVVSESETLVAFHQRITNLEKDVKELKTFDHSTTLLSTIKSEVLNAVIEYLGTTLDDALYKYILEKSIEDIKNLKMDHARKQQEPKETITSSDTTALEEFDQKTTLFKTITKSKSFNRSQKQRALYHAFMESVIKDEDAIDKGVADK